MGAFLLRAFGLSNPIFTLLRRSSVVEAYVYHSHLRVRQPCDVMYDTKRKLVVQSEREASFLAYVDPISPHVLEDYDFGLRHIVVPYHRFHYR